VSITGGTSASPIAFASAVAGGNWLTISPASGTTPVAAKVAVNPTSLSVGTYNGTITLTPASGTAVALPVTLIVKAPPPTLTAQPSPITFTYRRGDPIPDAKQLKLSTSGALLSFTATLSGGAWLSINRKSSVAFPAFPASLDVSVNPAGLLSGSYKGTIAISAPQASNKTQNVSVVLDVGAGPASLNWIFPAQVVAGSPPVTITLSGANFYSGTVIKAGATTLSSTLVGPNVMTTVVPAALLATTGSVSLVASNPGNDGGDSSPLNLAVAAAGPVIASVTNAASYVAGAIAPGEMVAIFGSGLGPDALADFTDPGAGGTIATTLSGTRVLFDATAAPVIYTSAGQVAVMTPYDVAGKTSVTLKVEYNATQSAGVSLNVAAHAPALFTAGGAGSGQAAALNFDETTNAYTLNSETSLAAKGTVIVLYATGEGVTTPASADGAIVAAAAASPNPDVTLQVGGKDATILYTGGIPGLVAGMLQINARLAADTPAGKSVPVTLNINGVHSQAGVTAGVK
jgi:uncharacterized protein (TIGR03437 family)